MDRRRFIVRSAGALATVGLGGSVVAKELESRHGEQRMSILPYRRRILNEHRRPEVLFGPQPDHRSETISFEVKDSAPNPEEAYDVHERQLKALRAICLLDPPLRAPIWMQVMHGWSVSEISRALNISK